MFFYYTDVMCEVLKTAKLLERRNLDDVQHHTTTTIIAILSPLPPDETRWMVLFLLLVCLGR